MSVKESLVAEGRNLKNYFDLRTKTPMPVSIKAFLIGFVVSFIAVKLLGG